MIIKNYNNDTNIMNIQCCGQLCPTATSLYTLINSIFLFNSHDY